MVNVHDAAHKLAAAIKESEEFKRYKEMDAELVSTKPELKELIDKFQRVQLQLQQLHLSGKQLTEEDMKESQELFEEINKDPFANEYFQAELKVSQLMTDVSKILGDAMDFRKNKEA